MNRKRFPLWSFPPHELSLNKGEVHLWRISLDLPSATLDELKNLLNKEEKKRAERLLDNEKARGFIAARGRLRQVLGRYLHLSPGEVQFSYNPNGKPELQGNEKMGLHFNLSHSGSWALLALTKGLQVGVDLEWIDADADYEKIAAQFFSSAEKEVLLKFSEARRRRGFYRIWTKKEAALKCLGHGFTSPEEAEKELLKRSLWCTTFPVTKNFIGSLSVEGGVDLVCKWEWAL